MASKAKPIGTREILDFIMHLICKDWDSRSVERTRETKMPSEQARLMAWRVVKPTVKRQGGGSSPPLKMIAHIQVRGMRAERIAELLLDRLNLRKGEMQRAQTQRSYALT
jgi:hypothetical protein